MLLNVSGVKKYFLITRGVFARTVGQVKAVDDVSFTLDTNETLGLVGESGCGKSTVARCILRLYNPTAGTIFFDGKDITTLRNKELKPIRRAMQVIFQDPLSSLNPRMTVENIIAEPLAIHRLVHKSEYQTRVRELLDMVGIPVTARGRYAHEFSGGQAQRIGIARALAVNPRLIVADEPVSALDVSVQAQIINLLKTLKRELSLSYLFIAHDLSVVHHISDRIAVMYLGRIVETGPANRICHAPLHPYSKALLSAVPVPEINTRRRRIVLSGDVPSPANPPPGCAFHTRCPIARPACSKEVPHLIEKEPGRHVRCPYA